MSAHHHWCAPVLVPDRRRTDPYGKALSASYRSLGVPRQAIGTVAGVERLAAAVTEADRGLLVPGDPALAHAVVFRMLGERRPDGLVLVSDTVRAPVLAAVEAAGLRHRFLPAEARDPRFGLRRPPRTEDVLIALERDPAPAAVLYTSPTPEGLGADTASVAEAVHARSGGTLVIVDETWGGHCVFHPGLPGVAMRSGADLCVQSAHQVAGRPRPAALVCWRDERIAPVSLERAFRELSPVLPGRPLLESVEAATRQLAWYGRSLLDGCLARAADLRTALRARLPGLDVLAGPRVDGTKTVLGFSGVTGTEVAERLARHQVFVDRAARGMIVLTANTRLTPAAVEDTTAALEDVLALRRLTAA